MQLKQHLRIMQYVSQHGSASVSDIATLLNVPPRIAYKRLTLLTQQRLLSLSYTKRGERAIAIYRAP